MDQSIASWQDTSASPLDASGANPPAHQMPTLDFNPTEVVRHRTARWHGVEAETIQIISHGHFEYSFKEWRHLLIAVDQGVRYDGETVIEGLPKSTLRSYSHRLLFVPAGRRLFGTQTPRLLPRSICVYIDPHTVAVDPDLRFADADLPPRLLFEDEGIWQTVDKLKARIGSADAGDRMYAEALGGVLAHELLRLRGESTSRKAVSRGGLAGWQQRRIIDFMEGHIAQDVSLRELGDLVRLSPYHFLRSFKQSFGEPPHRYWTNRRIERAKTLLANPDVSVTEIGFDLGFNATSAFSATFRRVTGQTPTEYRRSLE